MTRRSRLRSTAALAGSLLVVSACATDVTRSDGAAGGAGAAESAAAAESAIPPGEITRVTPEDETTAGRSVESGTSGTAGTGAAGTASTAPETPPTSAAPTTTEPPPRFYNDDCVIVVEPGDTLVGVVEEFDDGETINRVSLRAENGLTDERLTVGDPLDVCPGNGVDDMTGVERLDASAEVVDAAVRTNVEVQQLKLNQLFEPLGARELLVDGISGPVTRQRLCAARLALGLDVSTADMAAGSDEEQILLAADELPPPPMATVDQDRWVLIDQTCQFMFAGAVGELAFGFPTSTGENGYNTRNQSRSRAFRYDPATANGGWHNSSDFPVSVDNPLNGNMYKPIYFDGGQAIHGANNVPTSPQSKGCARLTVDHQNQLVAWLGLQNDTAPTWSRNEIRLTVSVQGQYQG